MGILHDEHTQLFELLAQLLDVKADDAVIDIHVGVVVKNVQRTMGRVFWHSFCRDSHFPASGFQASRIENGY